MVDSHLEPVTRRLHRDVLRVHGPDAVTYLQGQLSQDVAGLALGRSAWSFLLEPQGKVDAWLRVTRRGDEEVFLDFDGGSADAVIARLDRFKLRSKFEVERLEWECVAVRGTGLTGHHTTPPAGDSIVAPVEWPGLEGYDVLGKPGGATVPPGSTEVDAEQFEALRIAHGVPRMGAELTPATIPAEVGQWVVDASVSFTKGCYTGQELVARIDSRGGNVPRHLMPMTAEGGPDDVPPPGTVLSVDGVDAGRVTSSAWWGRIGQPVALAFVKRGVGPPTEVLLIPPADRPGKRVRAFLSELPLR